MPQHTGQHPCVYPPGTTMPQHAGQHPLCMELERVLCMILARAPYDPECCWNAVELCKAYNARLKACCAGRYGAGGVQPGSAGPKDSQESAEIKLDIEGSSESLILRVYNNKECRKLFLKNNWIEIPDDDLASMRERAKENEDEEEIKYLDMVQKGPPENLDEVVNNDEEFEKTARDYCLDNEDPGAENEIFNLLHRNDVWIKVSNFVPTTESEQKSLKIALSKAINVLTKTTNSALQNILAQNLKFNPKKMEDKQKYDMVYHAKNHLLDTFVCFESPEIDDFEWDETNDEIPKMPSDEHLLETGHYRETELRDIKKNIENGITLYKTMQQIGFNALMYKKFYMDNYEPYASLDDAYSCSGLHHILRITLNDLQKMIQSRPNKSAEIEKET